MDSTISCPHCNQKFELTQAFTKHLEEQVKVGEQQKFQQLLASQKLETEQLLQAQKLEFRQAFDKKLQEEQAKAVQKIQEQFELNLRTTKEELDDQKQRNQLLLEQLTELNKQMRELRNKDEQRQLEMEKRLLEEQEKIRSTARQSADEEHRLKQLELEKKLQDVTKINADLQRKLEQGSQQTQGEVLELELETTLRSSFPHDHIREVPKGITGADIIQEVVDSTGHVCGTILWESKNTKAWSPSWIDKLKSDQRSLKVELSVIVTLALPNTIENFSLHEGVWVTDRKCYVSLAIALRSQLLKVAALKRSQVSKGEKMEILYNYLSGIEFKQRLEAINEAFTNYQDELEKEKRFFSNKWARQEKHIRQVLDNTHGMYGDLQGIIGSALPPVSGLELEEETSFTKPDGPSSLTQTSLLVEE